MVISIIAELMAPYVAVHARRPLSLTLAMNQPLTECAFGNSLQDSSYELPGPLKFTAIEFFSGATHLIPVHDLLLVRDLLLVHDLLLVQSRTAR